MTFTGTGSETGPSQSAACSFTNSQYSASSPQHIVSFSGAPNNGSQCSLTFQDNGSISLSVTATLTWTPDAPPDTSLPPSTVDVLETGYAGSSVGLNKPSSVSTTASDGLGDKQTYPAPPTYGAQSRGSYFTQLSVPAGQKFVSLPLRSLSATLSWTPANANIGAPGMSMNYTVQLFTATLQGHSTVDTSAPGNPWDPTHPRFFSGTNCSAAASAPAINGYVLHAQLLVGGTDVKDYYDTSFVGPLPQGAVTGMNQTSAALGVNFDSTHFADAGVVPVQITVTDTGGNTYNGMIQASTYNEGYVGYEPTRTNFGPATASIVDSAMASCNTGHNDSTTSDTRDTMLAGIKYNTDFFTYSYGQHYPDANNPLFFESPSGIGNSNGVLYGNQSFDPSSTAQNPRNDAAEAIATKSVNPPPYNFVYLDICNGGYDSEFADGFGVSASGNTDRAFFGWSGWVEDSEVNQDWTQLLYTYIQSGEVLNQALKDANMISGGPPQDNNPNSPNYHLACVQVVKGDGNMTLHGTVYTGVKGSWFK